MLERNAINQVFSCLGIVFAWMYSQMEGNRLSILLNVEAFDTSYVRYLINIQFSEDSICLELLSTVILICSKPFKISVVIFGPPAVDEVLGWHRCISVMHGCRSCSPEANSFSPHSPLFSCGCSSNCPSFIYPTMSNEKGQEIYDATAIEATLVRKINWTAIPLLNIIQTIQVKGKYLNACWRHEGHAK